MIIYILKFVKRYIEATKSGPFLGTAFVSKKTSYFFFLFLAIATTSFQPLKNSPKLAWRAKIKKGRIFSFFVHVFAPPNEAKIACQ